MKLSPVILLSSFIVLLCGCAKTVDDPHNTTAISTLAEAGISAASNGLAYADTIFYPKNEPGNYIIKPVRRPAVAGYFKAIPLGLIFDSITGRINITGSETGLRYKMYYLGVSGQKIDSTQLVISGIDYADGIYDLAAGQHTAFPIYAANPGSPLPCDDDDDDDDNDVNDDDDCMFDERDLNDDGVNDIPGVNSKGFRVNRKNAVINLYATIASGALGEDPQNGAVRNFLFYYRLSDLSNRALQDIMVRLYYYQTVADIPAALINELKARKAQDKAVNSLQGGLLPMHATQIDGQAVTARPKRPPLIIIVGYNIQQNF